ncbi:MAG: DUF748 domain-containing protein [bacterium]
MRRLWVVGIVVALAAGSVVAASFLVDEPLRRVMEERINERLKGYTARVGKIDFHPAGFSLDLRDLAVAQNAHPHPPVLSVRELTASVHWGALLRGRLVADFRLEEPRAYINLIQLREEVKNKRSVDEQGWQEAVQSIYPLEINLFTILQGDFTYIDKDPERPLRASAIRLTADNIRNVRSEADPFPSGLYLEAVVFDSGKMVLDGAADFLAEPHPAVRASMLLERIDLGYFEPVAERYNLRLRKGDLSAEGEIEYAPQKRALELRKATIRGVTLDYLHTAETAKLEEARAEQVKGAAQEVANKPKTLIRVESLQVLDSEIGYVDREAENPYRLFFSVADLGVQNLSNHATEGEALVSMTGKFMGTGRSRLRATFRPEVRGADFDLDVRIEDTELAAMNDLLRTYGKFDVAGGTFSLYSEVGVKNERITGYVKPFFKDLEVYSPEQEKDKPLLKKAYEGLVGAVGKLLENPPREQVATQVDIGGPVENPKASRLETIAGLIRNAYFKAFLPGLEGNIRSEEDGSSSREEVPEDDGSKDEDGEENP